MHVGWLESGSPAAFAVTSTGLAPSPDVADEAGGRMRMLGMSMHALGKGGGGCMHLYDVRAIGVELRVAGGSQAEVALRRNARMRATGTGAGRLVDAYSTAPVTARSSVLAPCGGSRMSGMCSQPWAWQFVYGLYMRLDALLWRIYHGQARQAAACGESAACCWRDENGQWRHRCR